MPPMSEGRKDRWSLMQGVWIMRGALLLYCLLIFGSMSALGYFAATELSDTAHRSASLGLLAFIAYRMGWPALKMLMRDLLYQRGVWRLATAVDPGRKWDTEHGPTMPVWFSHFIHTSGREIGTFDSIDKTADELEKTRDVLKRIERHLAKIANQRRAG